VKSQGKPNRDGSHNAPVQVVLHAPAGNPGETDAADRDAQDGRGDLLRWTLRRLPETGEGASGPVPSSEMNWQAYEGPVDLPEPGRYALTFQTTTNPPSPPVRLLVTVADPDQAE
jgi:hypothetical protein